MIDPNTVLSLIPWAPSGLSQMHVARARPFTAVERGHISEERFIQCLPGYECAAAASAVRCWQSFSFQDTIWDGTSATRVKSPSCHAHSHPGDCHHPQPDFATSRQSSRQSAGTHTDPVQRHPLCGAYSTRTTAYAMSPSLISFSLALVVLQLYIRFTSSLSKGSQPDSTLLKPGQNVRD